MGRAGRMARARQNIMRGIPHVAPPVAVADLPTLAGPPRLHHSCTHWHRAPEHMRQCSDRCGQNGPRTASHSNIAKRLCWRSVAASGVGQSPPMIAPWPRRLRKVSFLLSLLLCSSRFCVACRATRRCSGCVERGRVVSRSRPSAFQTPSGGPERVARFRPCSNSASTRASATDSVVLVNGPPRTYPTCTRAPSQAEEEESGASEAFDADDPGRNESDRAPPPPLPAAPPLAAAMAAAPCAAEDRRSTAWRGRTKRCRSCLLCPP